MVEKVINYFNKLDIENLKEVFMFDFFVNKKRKGRITTELKEKLNEYLNKQIYE